MKPTNRARRLGDGAVNWNLSHRGQQLAHLFVTAGTGKELAPGDHRVRNRRLARFEASVTS